MSVRAPDTPVASLRTWARTIPTDFPEADGTLAWDSTTIVVCEASAAEVTGVGYSYAPAACASLVEELFTDVVIGSDPFDPAATWRRMVDRVRNGGVPGIASMAISAVDLALWDLRARLEDRPLPDLLGATRSGVPAYGSGGFTTYDEEQLRTQLEGWRDDGLDAVKIKIGEDHGRAEERDRARIRTARDAVGEDCDLFVDANGAYDAEQAVRVLTDVADTGVSWFEEPVSSDDLPGLRHVRDRVDADVAAGEYAYRTFDVERLCAAGAVDCLQLDVTRCGGITGWQHAVAASEPYDVPLSVHCAPAISLAPALATPRVRHQEWFHDHVRIERMLFEGAPEPRNGELPANDTPGNGLRLRSNARG